MINRLRPILLCTLLLLGTPFLLSAQYSTNLPVVPDLGLKLDQDSAIRNLFDPSRLTVQNSYSMQISTAGKQSYSTGLLQSTFEYYINPQVTVRGHIGLLHDPLSAVGPSNQQSSMLRSLDRNNLILGGEISYRPKENMLLQISFSQQPVPAYGYQFARPYPYRGYR